MLVIYVAGPLNAPTAEGVARNIAAAEAIGWQIAKIGAMPMIPHANTGAFLAREGVGEPFWYEGTLDLLRRCDAVVCTPDWQKSKGARAEVAEATRLGIPVHVFGSLPTVVLDPGEAEPARDVLQTPVDPTDVDEDAEAVDRLIEFLADTGKPGTPMWARYIGDKLRGFAAMIRASSKVNFSGRRLATNVAEITITTNPHLLPPTAPAVDPVDSAG